MKSKNNAGKQIKLWGWREAKMDQKMLSELIRLRAVKFSCEAKDMTVNEFIPTYLFIQNHKDILLKWEVGVDRFPSPSLYLDYLLESRPKITDVYKFANQFIPELTDSELYKLTSYCFDKSNSLDLFDIFISTFKKILSPEEKMMAIERLETFRGITPELFESMRRDLD